MGLKAYVDGSSLGNPGQCGVGIVFVSNDEVKQYSRNIGYGTNNFAELMAVKIALEFVEPNSIINIYSDSQYTIGILSMNWTAKVNKELVSEIKGILKSYKVNFIKVSGHSDDEYNKLADKLAQSAARLSQE